MKLRTATKLNDQIGPFIIGGTLTSNYSRYHYYIEQIRLCNCKLEKSPGEKPVKVPLHYHIIGHEINDKKQKGYFNYLVEKDNKIGSLINHNDEFFVTDNRPKKKRGRPAGTGSRSVNLHVRVQPEFIQLIEILQQSGHYSYKDKSVSDIMHMLLKDAGNKHRVFQEIQHERFISTLQKIKD